MSCPSLGLSYWPLTRTAMEEGKQGGTKWGNNRWAHGCWNTAHQRGHASFIEYGQLLDCQHQRPQHHGPFSSSLPLPLSPTWQQRPPQQLETMTPVSRKIVFLPGPTADPPVWLMHTHLQASQMCTAMFTLMTQTQNPARQQCSADCRFSFPTDALLRYRWAYTFQRLNSVNCHKNAVNKNKLCKNKWNCFANLTPHTDYHFDLCERRCWKTSYPYSKTHHGCYIFLQQNNVQCLMVKMLQMCYFWTGDYKKRLLFFIVYWKWSVSYHPPLSHTSSIPFCMHPQHFTAC